MKNKILMIIILIFSIAFFACNKSKENTKTPEEQAKTQEQTNTPELKTYSISYDLDGGECDNLINEFKENESVVLPTPTKTGYNFEGWYNGDAKVEKIENKNYNLLAKWTIKQLKIKIYNGEELIDSLKVDYGFALDTNKYIEKGLKFISANKDIENITEDGDIICVFETITDAIVFVYEEDKISCKAINVTFIGIQIEFNVNNNCEITSKNSLASVKCEESVCKYILTNKTNFNGINDLFELDTLVDISNLTIKAYYYSEEKELVEIDLTNYIIK